MFLRLKKVGDLSPFVKRRQSIELPDPHFGRFVLYAVGKRRLVLVFWAAFLAFFLQSFDAMAQAAAAVECESCHGVPGLQKEREGKTVSLHVDKEMFAGSVHGALGCANCHTDIAQFPHPSKIKPVDCSACHAGQVQNHADSIHGKLKDRLPGGGACSSCHGDIHRLARASEEGSSTHRKNIANTCATCHADAALAEKFRIPVVRPVESYLLSVHARAVAAGKPGAVCSDCHGSHSIAPGSNPKSMIARPNLPQTCGRCHENITKVYQQSIHGEALARGLRQAPVCTDCHGEHRIMARSEPGSPVFAANIPAETCGRCHGDTRMSEKFGLLPDKVPAFHDSFHGLALRAGQLTAANCASCHGVHDIRPSSDPRSHVHAANLPQTCGKCHPGAGTRFALGPVHVGTTANFPVLFWIRIIYLWVICITVGLMVAHNALDLIHKTRHRAESHSFVVTGEAPQRMSRSLRWQHGLIMVSFPLLGYTGFALTYPESWWAAPLLRWETSLGLRGYLHRAAAVILLAALVWHLLELGFSEKRRRRMKKQLFHLQDLRNLWQMVRYYLGLRSDPPHQGEFNYAEKFEYWAFMWGMVLMTVTGLLLWFENWSLQYLPKISTDIATTIHFYEAVLATLAIVFWHFYWVIFDPDVYPMDAAWWHGRSPAARLKERMVEEETASEKKAEPNGSQKTERG
jgi:cytochrome b subunit of formate dehydrogenase